MVSGVAVVTVGATGGTCDNGGTGATGVVGTGVIGTGVTGGTGVSALGNVTDPVGERSSGTRTGTGE